MGVGGDQLQPGVEDGGTPTEVVAALELRNPEIQQNSSKKKKTWKSKINKHKRRALSTRERGQPQHQQPGLPDLTGSFTEASYVQHELPTKNILLGEWAFLTSCWLRRVYTQPFKRNACRWWAWRSPLAKPSSCMVSNFVLRIDFLLNYLNFRTFTDFHWYLHLQRGASIVEVCLFTGKFWFLKSHHNLFFFLGCPARAPAGGTLPSVYTDAGAILSLQKASQDCPQLNHQCVVYVKS